MQELNINSLKQCFGIKIIRNLSEVNVLDNLCLSNYNIPLGEILFSIIDCINIFSDIAKHSSNVELSDYEKEKYCIEKLKEYFYDKQYDFTFYFQRMKIDILEVNRLKRIKDFIDMCVQNNEYKNLTYLKDLSESILISETGRNDVLKIFNKKNTTRKIKINGRKITAENPVSVNKLIEYFNCKYYEYSIVTYTKYNSLSELCIIALYEIFNSDYIICKCQMCGNYYIGNTATKYCDRHLCCNDFQGCKNYKKYLANQKLKEYSYMKLYKTVFARLQYRTKSNSINGIKNFEMFKKEWKQLKSDKTKNENDYINFLNDERWQVKND